MGIKLEPIYQAKKYRSGTYKNEIIKTLKNRQKIVDILNKHRAEPLDDSWQPISIYCEKCNRDEMKAIKYDGDHMITYQCELCKHEGSEDLLTTTRAKLPWRMDWPMRWAFEGVDFEPGGKDHSSQGGSYTTAKEIVAEVYGGKTPIYLQYDFVSVKGMGGKMSSSKGNLVTVNDVLDIYEPEMIRWIFANYKSNVDFGISFDLDVIKIYEDYDRSERIVYGKEPNSEKKQAMSKRVYELSSLDGVIPSEMPFQPSFRHLTNILQIFEGDVTRARGYYTLDLKNANDEKRFSERAKRANFWLANYAPEEFKFSVNKAPVNPELSDAQKSFLKLLKTALQTQWSDFKSETDLHEAMYKVIHEAALEPALAFTAVYQALISKEKGPKLANFLMTIGPEKVLGLL
jgi:lysyl-tRNA synthetase class 1